MAATTYTLTGPEMGEVNAASTFTLTPNGAFTGAITLSDGLSGGLSGTFDPASPSWSGTSEAKTVLYTPRFVGSRTIAATNDAALTDPAGLSFNAIPKVGAGWVPYPSTDPSYVPAADFQQPDLGGLTFFRDENGDPTGPFGEYVRPILDETPAPYSATIVSNCLAGCPVIPEGCFGNTTAANIAPYLATGLPYNVADAATDPVTALIIDNGHSEGPYPQVSDPGTFKVPANAAVQGVSGVTPTTAEQAAATAYVGVVNDAHLSVFLREADGSIRWLVETYHSYKDPSEPNVWHVVQVTLTDLKTGGGGCRAATPLYTSLAEYTNNTPSSNADAVCEDGQSRPCSWGGSEAAGVPIIPFCARYDEFERAQAVGPDEPIPHALRMTFQNYTQIQTGVAWSYPATSTGLWGGGYGYDQDKLIYGQRLKLSKTWWLANRDKYPPFARTLLATLATYGGFVADGGTKLAPTFIIDSRWPWSGDLATVWLGGSHGGQTVEPVLGDHFEVMPPIPYFLLECDPPATTHDVAAQTFTPMTLSFQVNPAAAGARWPTGSQEDWYYVASADGLELYGRFGVFQANTPGVQTKTVMFLDPTDLGAKAITESKLGLRSTRGGLFEPATFAVNAVNNPATPAASSYTLTAAATADVGSPLTVTIMPNGPYTGAITLTPSGCGLSAPVVLTFSGSSAPQTAVFTPAASGMLMITPSANPTLINPASFTVMARLLADAYRLDGPISGTVGAPAAFTVQLPAGAELLGPVEITPSDDANGLFSPASVTLSSTQTAATFEYRPTAPGCRTIRCTNDGDLDDPVDVLYTADPIEIEGRSKPPRWVPSPPRRGRSKPMRKMRRLR